MGRFQQKQQAFLWWNDLFSARETVFLGSCPWGTFWEAPEKKIQMFLQDFRTFAPPQTQNLVNFDNRFDKTMTKMFANFDQQFPKCFQMFAKWCPNAGLYFKRSLTRWTQGKIGPLWQIWIPKSSKVGKQQIIEINQFGPKTMENNVRRGSVVCAQCGHNFARKAITLNCMYNCSADRISLKWSNWDEFTYWKKFLQRFFSRRLIKPDLIASTSPAGTSGHISLGYGWRKMMAWFLPVELACSPAEFVVHHVKTS